MDALDEVDDPAQISIAVQPTTTTPEKTKYRVFATTFTFKRSQFVLQEEDTLIGRSAKLRCQLYWPAVLCLPRSFYTRGPTSVATGNTPDTSWLQILFNR
ncbi:TPA: hypothetical protein ACH3X1_005738 [Trebouxia sp. C0004]